MATKINPLDFGTVTEVKVNTNTSTYRAINGITSERETGLSMEVTIVIPLGSVEETEIIRDALMADIKK